MNFRPTSAAVMVLVTEINSLFGVIAGFAYKLSLASHLANKSTDAASKVGALTLNRILQMHQQIREIVVLEQPDAVIDAKLFNALVHWQTLMLMTITDLLLVARPLAGTALWSDIQQLPSFAADIDEHMAIYRAQIMPKSTANSTTKPSPSNN